jgi:parallel beta helix pectate lyase-like protein
MFRHRFKLVAAGTLATTMGIAAATAGATKTLPVPCGATIAESVTLTRDVKGCTGDGLRVTADNVTLDLGGHTVGGTGAGTGIVVEGSNVHVVDGAVRGFTDGVAVAGGWKSRLKDVTVSGLKVGDNARNGISVSYVMSGASVTRNAVRGNGERGLNLFELHGEVADNDIVANGTGIFHKESAGTVMGNRVSHNDGPGMRVADPYAVDFSHNVANRNAGDGIAMSQNYPGYELVVVTANVANRNVGYGIRADKQDFTSPGLPTDGGGNAARRNGNADQCLNIVCARKPNLDR